MADSTLVEKIAAKSAWYGIHARRNRMVYNVLKGFQIVCAAAIPVVAIASRSEIQRWTTAGLGALIGIVEGFLQLGQYQQNWLQYRGTREALKREELLHEGRVGPYAGVADPDSLYVERCDSIMSGETVQWLQSQKQAGTTKLA